MSTDFSLHALLSDSISSTSVTSPNNSNESTTCLGQLDAQKTLSSTPAAAEHAPVSGTKRSKRKREESDDKENKKRDSTEPAKKKRVRTAFTQDQLQKLEFNFAQNQYPDMMMRQNIAEELGLPDQKIHVWFQNRRAKLKRLRGQPTAVFPPPSAVYQSLHRPPLTLSQQSTATPAAVYLNPQPPPQTQPPQPLVHQSVGVQTQRRTQRQTQRFSISPSPSPIQLRVQDRQSLSSTPSVSPLSTPSGSPSMFNFISPPQNGGATAAGYPPPPPPGCSIVLPARTSPPAGSALHLPALSTNPLSFAAGSGQPFAAQLRVQDRRSLSSTPTVSPLSTPSGSPAMFNLVSPPQNGSATTAGYPPPPPPGCSIVLPARTSPPTGSALHHPAVSTDPPQNGGATAAGYPPPGCSIMLPARTSPPAGSALHLPAVSTNSLSFAAGSGQPFAAPLPYYHSPQTSSAAPVSQSAPMYFVDMNPPLSGNNRAGPPLPQVNFYQI